MAKAQAVLLPALAIATLVAVFGVWTGADEKLLFNAVASEAQKRTQPLIDKERLLQAARAGGDYLLRMQKADGSFHYSYDALHDRFESHTYNILRHAGTAYALFELYAATRDPRYLEAANRAVAFLKTRFRPAKSKSAVYVLDFDGKAKLGANGLALLALTKQLELAPKEASRDDARRLALMILSLQNRDGSFDSYHPVKGNEPEGNVSLYYPGEALLGLVRFYEIDSNRRWLGAAERGAEFLIHSQSNSSPLPPDAWLIQALESLYKISPKRQYFDHALAIAESLVAQQYATEDGDDYAGAFAPGEPRVIPAASRVEGIIAAYRMAAFLKDWRETKFALSLRAATRFQLSQQLTEADRHSLPNPVRALGGFRGSSSSFDIRIDYVQHNISSLLAVADALY